MKTIVIAPHPDDEILGVGGTLLRRKTEGAKIAWVIVTGISVEAGWSEEKVRRRKEEIKKVSTLFNFDSVYELHFPAAQLDRIAFSEIVSAISNVFKIFEPEEVFIPNSTDIHTDHRIVANAVMSCTKWFRYPSINRVLAYETLSETDFALGRDSSFHPNVFINIENYLCKKLKIMDIYTSELGKFPFPRSHEAIRALAILRGAASGFAAAESFELLRERF